MKPSDSKPVAILSGTLTLLRHFEKKGVDLESVMLVLRVSQYIHSHKKNPSQSDLRITESNNDLDRLSFLVSGKYLHEIFPKYGSQAVRYKLGSVGGSLVKRMGCLPPNID